jgi:hypothetical protein
LSSAHANVRAKSSSRMVPCAPPWIMIASPTSLPVFTLHADRRAVSASDSAKKHRSRPRPRHRRDRGSWHLPVAGRRGGQEGRRWPRQRGAEGGAMLRRDSGGNALAVQQLLVQARGRGLDRRADLLQVVVQLHQLVVRANLQLRDAEAARRPQRAPREGSEREKAQALEGAARANAGPCQRARKRRCGEWLGTHSVTVATMSSAVRPTVPGASG